MNEKIKGFVFLASYYEAIQNLEQKTQNKIINAIMQFVFCGTEKKLSGTAKAIFSVIKPNLESGINRYNANVNNGKKGGRPKTQSKPNQNPTPKPNQNLNNEKEKENDKENDNDNERENEMANNTSDFSLTENFPEETSLSLKDIKYFASEFPNKKLDLENVPKKLLKKKFDIGLLVEAINQSEFLKKCDNISFASCLKKYDEIISGSYKNFAKNNDVINCNWGRSYDKKDFESLIDNLEDIEI